MTPYFDQSDYHSFLLSCYPNCALLPLFACIQTTVCTHCLDNLLPSLLLVQIVNFFQLFLKALVPITQYTIFVFRLLLFFFLIFIYLFIYLWLCWVFVSVRGFSPVAASGSHSSSRCAGLSLSRPLLLRSTGSRCAGSVAVAHGLSCSAACGIFPDQGSNPCPCIGRQILNHCATREAPTIHNLTFSYMLSWISSLGSKILRVKTTSFSLFQLSSVKQVLAWDWIGTWEIQRGIAQNHKPTGFVLTNCLF